MTKTTTVTLCILTILLVACGFLGGSGLKIKVAGKEADFTQKFGFAQSTSMGANVISLANFEIPDFKDDTTRPQKLKADADGKMRIEIVLRIKDKKENTAFEIGEYDFRDWSKTSGGDKPEKEVDRIEVYFPNNGGEKGEIISHTGNAGTINITSVTDDEIAGTIDIEGKDGLMKGKFIAGRAKAK